jgi:hypothetical protein
VVYMRFDFKKELHARFAHAAARGAKSVIVNSGDVHRSVGGYPGRNHQMPVCCQVMYREQRAGDLVLSAPPKGQGATLSIEYQLPR